MDADTAIKILQELEKQVNQEQSVAIKIAIVAIKYAQYDIDNGDAIPV